MALLGTCPKNRDNFDPIDNKHYSRNNSERPTRFISDSNNEFSCRNGNSDAIVCDNQRHFSAVLDCHCVTYYKESQSTFARLCFYNCENPHSKKRNNFHVVTMPLPKEQKYY